MAKKVWTFEVERQHHVLELEHGFVSGKTEARIDGVPFISRSKFNDTGSLDRFDISGVPCVLHIKKKLFRGFDYELYVGGKKVEAQ